MKDFIANDMHDTKRFEHWNGESGYYDRKQVFLNEYQTGSGLSTSLSDFEEDHTKYNKKDNYLLKSVQINSWQRDRNRSQVVRKESVKGDQTQGGSLLPSLPKTSLFSNNYADIQQWIKYLQSHRDHDEAWSRSFDKYADRVIHDSKGLIASRLPDRCIYHNDVVRVVQDVLGIDTPAFIVDKFTLLGHDKSIERMLSWNNFKSIISRVLELLIAEVTKKSEIPTLVKLMNRPSIIDRDMGALGELSTVYRDSMSTSTKSKKSSAVLSRTYPHTAADLLLSSIPMDATAAVLSAGTARGTFHLPGYSGHIPRNKCNDRKVEHSYALHPRPPYENLLLTHRQIGCISGYTGHVSSNNPPYKERVVAMDPITSNGAAYGRHRRML